MTQRKVTTMNPISAGKERYLSNFSSFEKNLNGGKNLFLHDVRKHAIARFADLGFPTTHDEEWKYTDVSPLAKAHFSPIVQSDTNGLTKKDIEPFTFQTLPCHLLVSVDGHFSRPLSSVSSLPPGVIIGSLADAIQQNVDGVRQHLTRYAQYENDTFTALSTAFLQDGVFVFIPNDMILDLPIHVLFVSTEHSPEFVTHPRTLVVVGKNSQVSLIESYVSLKDNTYFTNTVSEVVLGENAVVEHDKLQRESENAFHVGSTYVHQERSSNFISNSITLGGSLVRNNVVVVLDGEGAEATLNGLYLGTGKQHIDNHTTIEHARPHCPSHELYKGILSGRSRGVFNGKIKVRKDAQKTDAKQTNKNLILSDEASIDTKPQLEIFANDVKCTHGATIGQMDEEAIFYFRSRGIGEEKARDILTFAFASDVVERIHLEPLRAQLDQMIQEKLRRGRTS